LSAELRRFVGCAPLEFLRTARLDQARRKIIAAAPGASVTAVAAPSRSAAAVSAVLAVRRVSRIRRFALGE
jgi:hypothetical protein